ncbi:hypothetical protein Daus18300_006845 [Diaporthe australafricana]|uniref:Uncharacterized protein n=1 Tax=Diaporthe australafricana TaxID=127596 RepID=A0ABR3WRA7_9PEZI
MAPLHLHAKRVGVMAVRDAPSDYGTSCSNGAWACLNTTAQFGIIFSVIIIVITIVWVYWYTVIRPRQEKIKKSDEDIELDLGDGRTIVVSSGPYQRTVVFRGARSRSPPPPAYRPPTPGGGGSIVLEGLARTTQSPQPSPRGSHTQIWPPQAPPQRPETPQQAPPQPMNTPSFVQGYPFPGSYSQPIPLAMYPPQFVVPGPPPPPPAMMYPRAQPQTYFVIPPPPPPPPGMPAQGLIPPPPPPPPSQPPGARFYQQPLGPQSQLRTRAPSLGHASTIEDDDSDRGGSLPPASPPGPRPPAGGSLVTCSRTPSPSERRRLHALRYPIPSPTPSPPPQGRQRDSTGKGNQGQGPSSQQDDSKSDNPTSNDTSSKSIDSLDSDLRTDLASLLVDAEDRKRAREAERLQALVDRYDKEEEEERQHRNGNGRAQGGAVLPRLPGQPMPHAVRQVQAAEPVAATSAQKQDPERGHQVGGPDDVDNEKDQINPPKRHVAFHEPSLKILESRVGRPPRPSQSPARIPTREDLHHGESRVERRHRTASTDERIVDRPVAPVSKIAESRIGEHRSPSPSPEQPVLRRGSHKFPDTGESRVGHSHGGKRRGTHPSETVSPGAGSEYYNTHDVTHGGHPTVDDGFLLNIARSEGPPSSAGATCGTRSQASSDSSDRRQRMDMTPSKFNRDRDQRGYEEARYFGSSTEESDNDENNEYGRKPNWGSKLASFLPTIARLTTNNPVVQEVADGIADEVRNRERREVAAEGRRTSDGRGQSRGQESSDNQQSPRHPRPAQSLPDPRQRRDARRPRSQQEASRLPRSSHDRYRSHRRRPSTIAEEPRDSLQLSLERAAERLAEEATESALNRTRYHGGHPGGQDDQRRRRPRRSRER